MGASVAGDFRLRYQIEDISGKLQRNEQALRLHEQRMSTGLVGGDPKTLNAQARYMNALTNRSKEARIQQDRLARSAGQLDQQQRKLYQSTVMGTQGYRNFAVALRRVGLWSAAGGTVYGIIRFGKAVADTGAQFQYFRKELEALSDEGEQALNELAASAMLAAYDTGRSFNEAFEVAKSWIRTGESAADTADLVRSSLIGMNLTNMDATSIMRALVAQLKAFDIAAEDSITIIDRLYGVAKRHAIEPAMIAEGLIRFSSAARVVGMDINEAYALMVGTLSRTQQSATMTGTAIRTIITRILKPAALDAIQTLAGIGPYADQAGTKFRNVFDILDDLARKWDELNQTERVFIASTIAGVRRIDQFTAMMENWDEVLAANVHSLASAGQAMKSHDILMDSLSKSLARLSAAWREFLGTRGGFTSFLQDVTTGLTLLIRKVQEMPDATRYILEALGVAAGGLVAGPWGAGIAGGAVLGLEGLGAAGAIAKKSLEELRSEYQQHLKLVETTAKSTWDLADRFLALAGETDGLTTNEKELARIQAELAKQTPELVSDNMTLSQVYSALSRNIADLGQQYADAGVKIAQFELAESRLRLYRARARETAIYEELPTPKDVVPGLKSRLKSRMDMLSAYVFESLGKQDWAEAIIDRYYEPYMRLVKKLQEEGRYTLDGLRNEAEKRWMLELSNLQTYLVRQDDLSDAENKRLEAARDRVHFWREVYKRVLDYESALRGVQAAEEQVKFWADEIERRRILPERTEPEGAGYIVPGLEDWMRKTKATITDLKKEIAGSADQADELAGNAKEGNRWAGLTLESWKKSGESWEDIIEFMGVAERLAKNLSKDNVRSNVEAQKMGVYFDQISPIIEQIKSKTAEVVEKYGEGDERVERLGNLLTAAEAVQGDITGLGREWANVAQETYDSYDGLVDVSTQIKATQYENTHLGEVLRHNMAMVAVEGGKIASLQTEIKALRIAQVSLDEEEENYLNIKTKLQSAINQLTEEESTLRKQMAEEWAQNELDIEMRLVELHEGKLAALNEEWFYWAQISAYAKDVEERQRAIMMMRQLSTQEQIYRTQGRQQAILQAANLAAAGIGGGLTAGGLISGAGAIAGLFLGGWPGIAVGAGSLIAGAVADRVFGDRGEKTQENTSALSSNTRAIQLNTQTLSDIRECAIAVPTTFTWPPWLLRVGQIPYPSLQSARHSPVMIQSSGLAYLHRGEVVSGGNTVNVSITINGAGRDAGQIADEVMHRLDRQFSIDSRRGYHDPRLGPGG